MSEKQSQPWYGLAIRGLLTLVFIGAASGKLLGVEEAAASFERFGYTAGFATFIGLCELSGAIGLWLPRLSAIAAAGLSIVMAGAVVSHFRFDPPSQAIPAGVLLILCLATVYWRRSEIQGWLPSRVS